MRTPEVRTLVSELFEEEALVLGGLVATHAVDDELVWSLVRSLDVIRRRTLGRVDEGASPAIGEDAPKPGVPRPHPAIEDFLKRIREDTT
jgi:hypothetical protein